jgi:arginine-tRNA-protein transferase
MRIKVDDFKPSRSQNRILKKNGDTRFNWLDAEFNEEHFAIYKRYMSQRHEGSSMQDDDPDHYMRIMKSSWCTTKLAEFRAGDQLVAIAITDWLVDGLSAVYTFFDPSFSYLSPGTYAIMKQVDEARKSGRKYVYLGYWIKNCAKMAYKSKFHATQYFNGHSWQDLLSI